MQPPNPIDTLRALYRSVLSTVEGQRLLEDLRTKYGDRQSYVPGDSHETAFREGQRSVYTLMRLMLAEPGRQEAITR